MSSAIQYSILRRKQVQARTGLARSTMYQQIQDGTFPRPIPLGPRAVGWLESEVSNWIAERVRIARSDVESNADGGRHDASAD